MLSFVSWNQYLLFLVVTGLIYYTAVWIFIFRAKLPSLNSIGRMGSLSIPQDTEEGSALIFSELQAAIKGKRSKNELIYAVTQVIKNNKNSTDPQFRGDVEKYIIQESFRKCSIHLSELDVREVWS